MALAVQTDGFKLGTRLGSLLGLTLGVAVGSDVGQGTSSFTIPDDVVLSRVQLSMRYKLQVEP